MREAVKLWWLLLLGGSAYNHATSFQTPYPIPANTTINPMITSATINLNLRYRFLSGGASELCGKYGGGVYVAMVSLLTSLSD